MPGIETFFNNNTTTKRNADNENNQSSVPVIDLTSDMKRPRLMSYSYDEKSIKEACSKNNAIKMLWDEVREKNEYKWEVVCQLSTLRFMDDLERSGYVVETNVQFGGNHYKRKCW